MQAVEPAPQRTFAYRFVQCFSASGIDYQRRSAFEENFYLRSRREVVFCIVIRLVQRSEQREYISFVPSRAGLRHTLDAELFAGDVVFGVEVALVVEQEARYRVNQHHSAEEER